MSFLDDLVSRYPELMVCKEDIQKVFDIIKDSYINCGKLLIAGNGGSASDSDHIVGELMKGFILERKVPVEFVNKLKEIDGESAEHLSKCLQGSLPAISLMNHNALNTAFLNDVDGLLVFAQQVYGYGNKQDVFMGISTSGNSKNVLNAAIVAKAKGMKVVALTGKDGGKLARLADVSIIVPETETFKIQELHLPVYHCLCLMLENYFFGNE